MKRFKNILCVVNTELKQNVALEHAVKLAGSNQASITVVEVIDEIPANTKLLDRVLSAVNIQAKIVVEHEAKLEQLIAPWRKKIEIKSTVLSGIVFLEVIYEVLRNGHNLVF